MCESVVIKRRREHASRLLSSRYEKLFANDCRLRSLMSRVNRCSREYSASLFSGVPGLRVTGYPSLTFDVSNLMTVVRNDFNGKWGPELGGVDSECFYPCKDALLDKFSISTKESEYSPKYENVRILLGNEFQHRFSRSKRDKRSRDDSPRDSKCKLFDFSRILF